MKPVCAVVGVGPGNGAAFARRFASEGYTVALLARTTELSGKLASSLPDARAYACDVTDAGSTPDDVAEIGFRLTQQRPSAWSFEVEARPSGEKW